MTFTPLLRRLPRQVACGRRGGFGVVLACLALLLHLAGPGLTAMPPVPPPAELQALETIVGDIAFALCSHGSDPSDPADDPTSPTPRHRPGHDCIACCSPASLAAVIPLAFPLPLPSDASAIATARFVSFGPGRSIYAARQRGPPHA